MRDSVSGMPTLATRRWGDGGSFTAAPAFSQGGKGRVLRQWPPVRSRRRSRQRVGGRSPKKPSIAPEGLLLCMRLCHLFAPSSRLLFGSLLHLMIALFSSRSPRSFRRPRFLPPSARSLPCSCLCFFSPGPFCRVGSDARERGSARRQRRSAPPLPPRPKRRVPARPSESPLFFRSSAPRGPHGGERTRRARAPARLRATTRRGRGRQRPVVPQTSESRGPCALLLGQALAKPPSPPLQTCAV